MIACDWCEQQLNSRNGSIVSKNFQTIKNFRKPKQAKINYRNINCKMKLVFDVLIILRITNLAPITCSTACTVLFSTCRSYSLPQQQPKIFQSTKNKFVVIFSRTDREKKNSSELKTVSYRFHFHINSKELLFWHLFLLIIKSYKIHSHTHTGAKSENVHIDIIAWHKRNPFIIVRNFKLKVSMATVSTFWSSWKNGETQN